MSAFLMKNSPVFSTAFFKPVWKQMEKVAPVCVCVCVCVCGVRVCEREALTCRDVIETNDRLVCALSGVVVY